MTNLFQISLNADECEKDFQSQFTLAYNDILKLTKLLCSSEVKSASAFIESCFPDDPPWLSYDEDGINILTEMEVLIRKNDKTKKVFEYDFGKRSPADDHFLFAVMSILKHYIPNASIYREADIYREEFDGGVLLARIVNPKINNPYKNGDSNLDYEHIATYVQTLCEDLLQARTG